MPQFRYRAVTHAGEIIVGEVEASSREEVVRRIEYLGHLPIDAEVAATGSDPQSPARRKATAISRCFHFSSPAGTSDRRRINTRSGAPDARRRHQQGIGGLCQWAACIDLRRESLAEAQNNHPSAIDPPMWRWVRVGEASGKLEAVLRAIVEDRTRRELMTDRINSAIRYPYFLSARPRSFFVFSDVCGPAVRTGVQGPRWRLNSGAAVIVAASIWLRANVDLFLGMCCFGCRRLAVLRKREAERGSSPRLQGLEFRARWATDVPRGLSARSAFCSKMACRFRPLKILRDV
jgi:general secretion pathway protein F